VLIRPSFRPSPLTVCILQRHWLRRRCRRVRHLLPSCVRLHTLRSLQRLLTSVSLRVSRPHMADRVRRGHRRGLVLGRLRPPLQPRTRPGHAHVHSSSHRRARSGVARAQARRLDTFITRCLLPACAYRLPTCCASPDLFSESYLSLSLSRASTAQVRVCVYPSRVVVHDCYRSGLSRKLALRLPAHEPLV
jgi:hypothetical protein